MRVNANLTIHGSRVVLVPYRPEHVRKYHAWMESAELREATASERLTLEEELAMQRSWAEDADKCTFIVLDRDRAGAPCGGMCGDVNLFLCDPMQEGDRSVAEVEIMIAEPESRRKGLAREALTLFMAFAAAELGVTKFVAKVGEANAASLRLFREGLGGLRFEEVRFCETWREHTLALRVEGAAAAALREAAAGLVRGAYDTP